MRLSIVLALAACSGNHPSTPTEPRVASADAMPAPDATIASAPIDAPIDAAIDGPVVVAPLVVAPKPDPAPVLPACDVACNHAYDCRAKNELAVFHYCMATCDAKKEAELRSLGAASCDEVATRVAAPGAPIKQRSCVELVKARAGTVPMGRHEAFAAHSWCAVGKGPLSAGAMQFEANAVLWGAVEGCWTLDAKRLWWTLDGVTWQSGKLAWPNGDGDIGVGAQKLSRCKVRNPPPKRNDKPHGSTSSKTR